MKNLSNIFIEYIPWLRQIPPKICQKIFVAPPRNLKNFSYPPPPKKKISFFSKIFHAPPQILIPPCPDKQWKTPKILFSSSSFIFTSKSHMKISSYHPFSKNFPQKQVIQNDSY